MTDATHPSAEPTPPRGDTPAEGAGPAPELAAPAPREPIWQKVLAAIERPGTAGFLATIGVLLALVLGGAVRSITLILIYIVLGLFLALALDPIVRMLERRGRKRGTGITLVFAGFLVIVGFFTIFLLPPVVNQIGQFIATAPEAILGVQEGEWFAQLTPDAQAAVSAALIELSATLSSPEFIAAIGGGALALGLGLVSFITGAIIVIALTLYFLASLSDMKNALYALAPARNRPRLADMTERVTASVGSSIIGSVILAGLNAGTVFVLHWVIDLPFAALMAAVAFVITLIPLFGSVIFLVIGSVVALFTSPTQALMFAIAYLIYIQIESYILSPRIMNRAISIPGVLVLIGAMVGGTLLGVLGVLLALPTMAMILLIIREVWVPKQDLKV
ncbi:AI-2E family transporter [Microbacterium sp. P5_E9]